MVSFDHAAQPVHSRAYGPRPLFLDPHSSILVSPVSVKLISPPPVMMSKIETQITQLSEVCHGRIPCLFWRHTRDGSNELLRGRKARKRLMVHDHDAGTLPNGRWKEVPHDGAFFVDDLRGFQRLVDHSRVETSCTNLDLDILISQRSRPWTHTRWYPAVIQ